MSTKNAVVLFGSKTREAILSLFFISKKTFYLREIANRLNISAGTVQRELINLMALDLIIKETKLHQSFYKLNENHYLYPELMNLFKKNNLFLEEVKNIIQSHQEDIKVAFIYGSYASKQDLSSSDVDIFIIGNISSMFLTGELREVELKFGREINLFIISLKEFKEKIKENNHFILTVMKAEKQFLIGENDEVFKPI